MDKQAATAILTRYQAGNCTEDERQLVESWILHGAATPLDLNEAQLLEDLLDIRSRLAHNLHVETPVRKLDFRSWLPYAAALLLIIFGISFYYSGWPGRTHNEASGIVVNDIPPGGNRATLTMANGRTIGLSDVQSEIIIGENGIMYSNGKAVFDKEQQAELYANDLQLTVPKGGTYQVTLSDGTKVWLNSASTLTYPGSFSNSERMVALEGEAYFEVSDRWSSNNNGRRTKVPFLVKTRDQVVKVLGTQFNISAYADEDKTLTTLVEGSVMVMLGGTDAALATSKANRSIILKPGTQSTIQRGEATVTQVDVSTFIGWKDGYFVFNGVELREAMKQLGRWYDVEVSYEGVIPQTPFYGKISRSDTLAEILAILKESKVNFRIEQHDGANRLVVMP